MRWCTARAIGRCARHGCGQLIMRGDTVWQVKHRRYCRSCGNMLARAAAERAENARGAYAASRRMQDG